MPFCEKCGGKYSSGAQYCQKCGTPLIERKAVKKVGGATKTGLDSAEEAVKSGMDDVGEFIKSVIDVPFELLGLKPEPKKRKKE